MARRLSGARRRAAWALLALAVLLLHAAVTRWISDSIAGWGDAAKPPERLAAVFVREVKPAAAPPPPQPPPAPPKRKPRAKPRPKTAEPAASQPQVAEAAASQPHAADAAAAQAQAAAAAAQAQAADAAAAQAQAADAAAQAQAADAAAAQAQLAEAELPPPPAPAASGPEPALPMRSASEPALAPAEASTPPPAAAASAPPAVEWPSQWPASTRLSYALGGWYRGELHGGASVEWLRAGSHYQVHLEVAVGPSFAPFMARRMSSDGELTADGLAPRRYDEETRVGLSSPRRATIRFEPDAVVMPNGSRRERWLGVQDAASQFVHLSWLFTTQPQLLAAGNSIEIPLALPRSVDRWAYDVLAADDLRTSFGTLPVLHLKPRRLTRPGGDLVFEAWFAPTLLYLPVRIRIHQDEQNFVDLMIDRPPLQSAPVN